MGVVFGPMEELTPEQWISIKDDLHRIRWALPFIVYFGGTMLIRDFLPEVISAIDDLLWLWHFLLWHAGVVAA